MNDDVFCPDCPPVFRKKNPSDRCGVEMIKTEDNYSGTGVDVYYCSLCKKEFFVSYKVDEITQVFQ